MTLSSLFLLALFLMIVVYAWKAPRRLETQSSFQARPPPTSMAERVIVDIEQNHVRAEVAAAPFRPVEAAVGIVAFSDSSTIELQDSTWVSRPSSNAETALATLWKKKCIRECTTMLIKELTAELPFPMDYNNVTQRITFEDGTAIYYNGRLHSWMLDT